MTTKYCIIDFLDVNKIIVEDISEISLDVLLRSPDKSHVLISWEGKDPDFLSDVKKITEVMNYELSVTYLYDNDWGVWS
jgi:hypothetical protein